MTAPAVTPGHLNAHQQAVLRLIANGLTAAQIATRVGRHHDTIRGHLANAYAALGAHSAAHAVAIAMARGLIHAADITTAEEIDR